jgi:hypothetical protein
LVNLNRSDGGGGTGGLEPHPLTNDFMLAGLSRSLFQARERHSAISSRWPCFMLLWGRVSVPSMPVLQPADATFSTAYYYHDHRTFPYSAIRCLFWTLDPFPAAETCICRPRLAPHRPSSSTKTHFPFCHGDEHCAGRLATGKLPSPRAAPYPGDSGWSRVRIQTAVSHLKH